MNSADEREATVGECRPSIAGDCDERQPLRESPQKRGQRVQKLRQGRWLLLLVLLKLDRYLRRLAFDERKPLACLDHLVNAWVDLRHLGPVEH